MKKCIVLSSFMKEDFKSNPLYATGKVESRYSRLFGQLFGDCSICLNKIANPIKMKSCCHIFCFECISKWLKEKSFCPLCKKECDGFSLIYKSKNK